MAGGAAGGRRRRRDPARSGGGVAARSPGPGRAPGWRGGAAGGSGGAAPRAPSKEGAAARGSRPLGLPGLRPGPGKRAAQKSLEMGASPYSGRAGPLGADSRSSWSGSAAAAPGAARRRLAARHTQRLRGFSPEPPQGMEVWSLQSIRSKCPPSCFWKAPEARTTAIRLPSSHPHPLEKANKKKYPGGITSPHRHSNLVPKEGHALRQRLPRSKWSRAGAGTPGQAGHAWDTRHALFQGWATRRKPAPSDLPT